MTKVAVELIEANPTNIKWAAGQSTPSLSSSGHVPPAAHCLRSVSAQHALGWGLEHVRHSGVLGIQGSMRKNVEPHRKMQRCGDEASRCCWEPLRVNSQEQELSGPTLKHSEEPDRHDSPHSNPWQVNHATWRPHSAWHFAQHYMSSIRWLCCTVGETGPQCATGVLHPLLHVPAAPCRDVTTEPQTGWIS